LAVGSQKVYEESIESVSHVCDFIILMDAYLQFEEGLLEATMESQSEMEDYNTAEMSGTSKKRKPCQMKTP
jgi:hypothetical protein